MTKTMQSKTVLITGCSAGGVGEAMCKVYRAKGYKVFAGLRSPAKAGELASMSNVEVVAVDITSAESIRECAQTIEKSTGGRLDILVNNAAGVGEMLPLLDLSIDKAKACFEVNVWGTLAMCQAFGPLVIEAKGTICNVSSVMSELVFAYSGVYSSSKSASRSISEILRLEMEPLGVTVVTAVLGGISTWQNDPDNRVPQELPEGSYYKPIYPTIRKFQRAENFTTKQNVDVAARNIVEDTEKGVAICRRGEGSTMSWYGNTFMPHSTLTAMVNKDSGLSDLKRR